MKMDGSEFETTVDEVEDLVKGIGYSETDRVEIPSPPEERSEDEANNSDVPESLGEVIIVEVNAGPNFIVIAQKSRAYFEIQSSYPLWQDLATALTSEEAREIVPESLQEEVPEDHPVNAEIQLENLDDADERIQVLGAFELLRRVDLEVRKELVYQLSKIFTRAEVKHIVNSPDEKAAPHEFTVKYKIFPYDNQFGPQELNEMVEKVRMAAHRGTLYLRYAFNLGVDIDRNTAGDVDTEPQPPGEEGSLENVDDLDMISDQGNSD